MFYLKKIQNLFTINETSIQSSQLQNVQEARFKIDQINPSGQYIFTTAISNNLLYIITGESEQLLKIWNYRTYTLIKSIKLIKTSSCFKFTEDSKLFYYGSHKTLYQFHVSNIFKKLCKYNIHDNSITNIHCITNTIILTSSMDRSIIKTDLTKKLQVLKIQGHCNFINGLDYNKNLDIIASGSHDHAIKLWDGYDGSLKIERLNAHKICILQVLFIINNQQLISLDFRRNIIIWNINFKANLLEQQLVLTNCGFNISLVFQQQYIITTGKNFIKVYTIKGKFIREFSHEADIFMFYNTIQHEQMQAVLILGNYKLYICKIEWNSIK